MPQTVLFKFYLNMIKDETTSGLILGVANLISKGAGVGAQTPALSRYDCTTFLV